MARLRKFLLVAPALLAIIVDYFGWGLVYPLATALMDDPQHGFLPMGSGAVTRDFYLSCVFFLYPLCLLFGSSTLGDLSDIYGRKKILLICTIGIGISFLCMGVSILTSSFGFFLLGRAISGFMAGSAPIAQAAVVDISAPEDKPFNLALLSITFAIGLVLGPLVGSLLSDSHIISWFGYTTPLFFSAVLAFLTAYWIRSKFSLHERLNPTKTFSPFRPILLFKEALQTPELRHLSYTLCLFQFGVSLYIQTMLILLNTHLHYTSVGLSLFWVLMGIGFVLGLFLLKLFVKTSIHITQLIFFALSCQALLVMLSSFFLSGALLWLFGFLFSLLNPFSYALLMAIFSDAAPQESQGWVMGIWSATVALAFIFGGLANNLLPWLGLDPVVFLGGLAIGFSALVFRRAVKR